MNKLIKPNDADIKFINTFYNFVVEGGQIKLVPAVLMKQICVAKILGINFFGGKPLACAAIKTPQDSYLEKVFARAGVRNNGIKYELGYCFTNPEFWGRGIMTELVSELMMLNSEKTFSNLRNLFATTKSPAMAKILVKNGFVKNGKTHENIDLYTYEC